MPDEAVMTSLEQKSKLTSIYMYKNLTLLLHIKHKTTYIFITRANILILKTSIGFSKLKYDQRFKLLCFI